MLAENVMSVLNDMQMKLKYTFFKFYFIFRIICKFPVFVTLIKFTVVHTRFCCKCSPVMLVVNNNRSQHGKIYERVGQDPSCPPPTRPQTVGYVVENVTIGMVRSWQIFMCMTALVESWTGA